MFLCKTPNESDKSFRNSSLSRVTKRQLLNSRPYAGGRPQREALLVDHDKATPPVGVLELLVGSRMLLGRQAVTQS